MKLNIGILLTLFGLLGSAVVTPAIDHPNILWISAEDIGPHLGCYGDSVARTPNLDALAADGVTYTTAWSTHPVCAPARTTIITGMYPASTGGEHMRSMQPLPEHVRMFPSYLRDEGYYCSNNNKQDYNHPLTEGTWDASSKKAHYDDRAEGQSFYAVFNYGVTHESGIRRTPHELRTDPSSVRVPAYHPDRPEVRRDWAQYYDNIAAVDATVGSRLDELKKQGLWEETIVIFFGDHGSGMPRNKRYPGDSGLRVPLIVRVPEKYRSLAPPGYATGGVSDRRVGFIDLAPTMLSLVGIEPPAHMQGHAFMGAHVAEAPEYLFGGRGRMDERIDLVRSVRDRRYLYLRNYLPHRPHGQHVEYQFKTRTTALWKELFDAGSLSSEQAAFWEPRPPEELYDLETDPDAVHNLAGSREHRQVLERLRGANRRHLLSIRDVSFVPEPVLCDIGASQPPRSFAVDPTGYRLNEILTAAEAASRRDEDSVPSLVRAARSDDPTLRYWGATGLLVRGEDAVRKHTELLRELALKDDTWIVRVVAAEALARFGEAGDRERALFVLLLAADHRDTDPATSLAAFNAIDNLGPIAKPILDALCTLPDEQKGGGRGAGYGTRVKSWICTER